MRRIQTLVVILVVLAGFASLGLVLAPDFMQLLWAPVEFAGNVSGKDLPSFGEVKGFADKGLAGFVIGLVGYSLWLKRHNRSNRAEYEFKTGHRALVEKHAELNARFETLMAKYDFLAIEERKSAIELSGLKTYKGLVDKVRTDELARLERAETAEKKLAIAQGALNALLGQYGELEVLFQQLPTVGVATQNRLQLPNCRRS